MANSGCYQITLACESGVQRVLDDIINKRLPLETIYPSIENAKKAGMLVHTFWIIGYPGETYEEIQKTVDFAMNSGADSFSFAILSPLPGTPIYREIIKKTKGGGSLKFGTEIVNSSDGSLSALLGASPGASTAVSIMVEVLEKSVLFLNDKHNLQKKINDLIYPELSVSENYSTFIKEIKKRNNSIFGFHP